MRRKWMACVLLASLLVAGGCYHVQVTTGQPASADAVEKRWAHGFLWGLIPPSEVETSGRCTSGVAKFESRHSFLNMLVGWVTLWIYTPMEIRATCAK